MELEFDKEIDALLRGNRVPVGTSPGGPHPDADELAAFAENAIPERAKALHMAHIADCDRCRKILSSLIALNAEAEPEMAAAAAPVSLPAVESIPWYRKLFLFPNLAYVMGGLVLIFGGLIGISVYQSSSAGDAAVSQVTDNEAARGPMAPTEPLFADSAAASNTMANTAASASNSNLSLASSPTGAANAATNSVAGAAPRANREGMPLDATPATSDVTTASEYPAAKPAQPLAAAPPPPAAEAAPQKDADLAKEDDSRAVRLAENEKTAALKKKQSVSLDGADAKNIPRTQAGGVAKSTPGPTRDMQQNFPNRAENTYELKSRRVSGKDFQYRNGAWYDTDYRGQTTTNVRRGSDEYRKLDSGLRTIAESLSGVVVTVWGGKAYRIQ